MQARARGGVDALRAEVAGDGVKVVLVEPGLVRTGIWDEPTRSWRPGRIPVRPSYRRLLTMTRLADPIMADPRGLPTPSPMHHGEQSPPRYLWAMTLRPSPPAGVRANPNQGPGRSHHPDL